MGIMQFGPAVRKRREELGFSVDDLARKVGVQRNSIYEIERCDVKDFYVSTFWAIARSLRWTAEEAKRAYEGKDPYGGEPEIKDRVYEAVLEFVERLPNELTDQ